MIYSQTNRLDEKDRMPLKNIEEYRSYFNFLMVVFNSVLTAVQQNATVARERELLVPFLKRLIKSFDCLCMKYLFDANFKMKIDQSDSSYPNAYELNMLADDAQKCTETLSAMKPRSMIIGELIKSIYGLREDVSNLQSDLALRTYYEYLKSPDALFLPFTKGEITRKQDANNRATFCYQWAIYEDTLSIPMLFQLDFETDKATEFTDPESQIFKRFLHGLNFESKSHNPLADIVSALDSANDDIYPKSLQRLTIGPLYGPYSTSESEMAKIIFEAGSPDVYALEVQCERVVSLEEKRRKKGIFTTDSKSVSQVFGVSNSSRDTILRKVEEYKAFLFTPHEIAQKLLALPTVSKSVDDYIIVSL